MKTFKQYFEMAHTGLEIRHALSNASDELEKELIEYILNNNIKKFNQTMSKIYDDYDDTSDFNLAMNICKTKFKIR